MKIYLVILQLCIIIAVTLATDSSEKEKGDQLDLLFIIAGNVLADSVLRHKVDYGKALKMFIRILEAFKKEKLNGKKKKEDDARLDDGNKCVLSDSESSSSESGSDSHENTSGREKCLKEKSKKQKKARRGNSKVITGQSHEDADVWYNPTADDVRMDGRRSLTRRREHNKHATKLKMLDTWSKKNEDRENFNPR